ncbi:MAG: RMD1 family protein [Negativicutes bacterium]|nr:RMD1 family protein [Negativicutes bacterium]
MKHAQFKALVLSSEIHLNKIARHFGINRTFKWQDALILRQNQLEGIVRLPADKEVHIFHFGSVVFVNCQDHEMMDIIQYLKRVEKSLNTVNPHEYSDDYLLRIDPAGEPAITNDCLIASAEQNFHREIVTTVLAKSVALEKIESSTDQLLDEIEDVVESLRQGNLNISDEQLAKMSARILGYKFTTISYIMLLDKPDITWFNEDAAGLFAELSALFELGDRYEKLKHKTDTLMDITAVFSGLAHAKRGTRLEWAVIILIAIEIVLSLYSLFFAGQTH